MGLHFIKERAHFIYLLFFGFFKILFIYLFYSLIPFFYLLMFICWMIYLRHVCSMSK